MSVPLLDISKLSIKDFEIHDKSFYQALKGEDTLGYISRIMGAKDCLNADVIANFLNRIKSAKAQDLFFQEVLRNIPRLQISDGYRKKLESTLAGKVFYTNCPVKIKLYLDECQKRNSAISIEEWLYLQNHLQQMHDCLDKRAIEEVLKHRQSSPQFELERIVWICRHEDTPIPENELESLAKLGIPSPELFIFTQTHSIKNIQHWSRKSLIHILTLEGKKELLHYCKTAPKVAGISLQTALLEKLQSYETLLDYKCTTGKDDQDFFQLDAEFTKQWQEGPGQIYTLAKINSLATLALHASDRLLSTRVHAKDVFSKSLVSSGVGDEALRNHVIDLMKKIFALYHYETCSEDDLADRCEGNTHFRFSCQNLTYYVFNVNPKELIVKNTETHELSSAEMPRLLTSHDKLLFSDRVSALFPGDMFEMNAIARSQQPAMDDEHWDSWQSDDQESWQLYRSEIHPLLHSAAVYILRKSISQDLVAMEVCGGSGALANDICKYIQKPFSYILLERNTESLQLAKKTTHKKHVQLVQTDVIADTVFFSDEQKTTPIKQESVDLCIGSGALTQSVLSNKTEALIVLDKITGYLKSGGYLLLAGLTKSLLTSHDFTDRGLRVINTHASGYRPMYIVQKP